MEDAGIPCAISRLTCMAGLNVPSWLYFTPLHVASNLLSQMSNTERHTLCSVIFSSEVATGQMHRHSYQRKAVSAFDMRLAIGIACERVAREEWEKLESMRPRTTSRRRPPRTRAAQLMFDSYAASLWTSLHVEATVNQPELLDNSFLPHSDIHLHLLPSHSTEYRLAHLLDARAFATQPAGGGRRGVISSATHPLAVLLSRSVNPASRGWKGALEGVLRGCNSSRRSGNTTCTCMECTAATAGRRVVINGIIVCMAGLHPAISPSHRPSWNDRLAIVHTAHAIFQAQFAESFIFAWPDAMKEVARRMLATQFSSSIAKRVAAVRLGNPAGRLIMPPLDVPPDGMLHAMQRLCKVGRDLVAGRQQADMCCKRNLRNALHATMKINFPNEATPEKRNCSADDPASEEDDQIGMQDDDKDDDRPEQRGHSSALSKNATVAWIGRSKQRITRPRIVDRASDTFVASFNATFLPFWMRATAIGGRPQRLDEAQHIAIHGENAAVKLCKALVEDEALRVHRAVLRNPCAALLTVRGAWDALGGTAARDQESLFDVPLEELGAHACARLLHFGRLAWLSEHVLVVDLGERTRTLQLLAIGNRHLGRNPHELVKSPQKMQDLEDRVAQLPTHVTQLAVCAECGRVANCTVGMRRSKRSVKDNPSDSTVPPMADRIFNEIGVSSVTTLHRPRESPVLYCALRRSAALKTAMNGEALARKRRVDMDVLMHQSCEEDSTLNEATSTSIAGEQDQYDDEGDECEVCSELEDDDPLTVNEHALHMQIISRQNSTGEDVSKSWTAMLAMAHDGHVASSMRRDCHRALEQRSCARLCGSTPLIHVPLLGRAVRVSGQWFALCSYCANVIRVETHMRIGGEIACLRCPGGVEPCGPNALSLSGTLDNGTNSRQNAKSHVAATTRYCRYCGKREAPKKLFKEYWSPHDTSGGNAELPPELRTTSWCSAHDRTWLGDMLKLRPTRDAMAHIIARAVPHLPTRAGHNTHEAQSNEDALHEGVEMSVPSQRVHSTSSKLKRKREHALGNAKGKRSSRGGTPWPESR